MSQNRESVSEEASGRIWTRQKGFFGDVGLFEKVYFWGWSSVLVGQTIRIFGLDLAEAQRWSFWAVSSDGALDVAGEFGDYLTARF